MKRHRRWWRRASPTNAPTPDKAWTSVEPMRTMPKPVAVCLAPEDKFTLTVSLELLGHELHADRVKATLDCVARASAIISAQLSAITLRGGDS